ncbi:O-antigen ligase family protein [Salinimicrobium sp. MT39]|uniref:O-antigen ligase family protein n=1 Tax=Salinimicrobium profundisediminis TaxID=2994553 RepID=A0A9X3CVN9_9FLAO|nr:O-antigen ligase family protein [Salinimicrobium profundisediminis]
MRYKRPSRVVQNLLQVEYIKLVLLHLAIAFAIYLYEPLSMLYSLSVFAYFIFTILQKKNKNNEALMAAAYIAGVEIFWRMTGGVVFYETGKYAVIVFLLIGMLFKGTSAKTTPFWLYLLILVPGIVIASLNPDYDEVFRKAVAFNLSGPVCLGVSALYCYYKKISKKNFQKVLLMLLLPIITNMFYLFFYTPSLQEMVINIGANYAATGGYGPNQIATIMGMGSLLLVIRLFDVKGKWVNLIDLGLLGMMSYRAIITFSRGGIVTALICAAAFIFLLYYKKGRREQKQLQIKIIFLVGVLFASWALSAAGSSGLIVNRWTGKDARGREKEDLTTGRVDLLSTELEAFYHNPVVGVGVGKAKSYREEELGEEIATHSEVSRLLSEHGLLGLLGVAILVIVPMLFWLKFKNNYFFLCFMLFWFLTVNHSAMRIALPAFVYGLALLYIVDDKRRDRRTGIEERKLSSVVSSQL